MRYLLFVLSLGLSALTFAAMQSEVVAFDGNCCQGCGCGSHVVKYCRVICEIKEVKEPKFSCVCEDFCVPGKSKKCGCQWIPGCAKVHTKRKLVVSTDVKKKPSWKWVVEYRCPGCAGCAVGDDVPAPSPADMPPMAPPAKPASMQGLPELRPAVFYPANKPEE